MFRFHSHGSSLLTLCRFVQLLRQCHQHHILQTESRMWKTCMGFYGNSEKFNQKIISYNVIDDQGKRTTKNYRKSTRRVSDLLNQLEITPAQVPQTETCLHLIFWESSISRAYSVIIITI